ncbi:MAG: hypothetical protein V1659_00125 [Candidatus Woesearchaeota archaeon]
MATTIQVSDKLMETLKSRKMYDKESYEELIWDLLEDSLELSEQAKQHIAQSEKEIAAGKTVPLDEIKKRMKL